MDVQVQRKVVERDYHGVVKEIFFLSVFYLMFLVEFDFMADD